MEKFEKKKELKKNRLQSHNKVCENLDFCGAVIPSKNAKILEFNKDQKSDKALSIIYADLEFLVKKVVRCKNNPEKSSTTKIGEYITCEYSMSKNKIPKDENRENVPHLEITEVISCLAVQYPKASCL